LLRLRSSSTNSYGWNEETNPVGQGPWRDQIAITWDNFDDVNTWLANTDLDAIRRSFEEHGYAVVHNIIPKPQLRHYTGLYDSIQGGAVDASSHRHDLGGHKDQVVDGKENVGQIMWPSDLVAGFREGPLHERSYAVCKSLLGQDTAFDFDMLIYKDPHTATETPWHQDEAYWPSGMSDKRAITVWCALDEATVDNGAMWYIKGSHQGRLREHQTASAGSHILMTEDASEDEDGATCVPLPAGSAVLWHGRTCHYSRGNVTAQVRRTFICNFRPEAMVQWERQNGFDHLRNGFDDYAQQKVAGGDVYVTSETSAETIKAAVKSP